MLDPAVARFFRSIADDHLLSRLEVVAMRLLGCETAVSPSGKRILRLLARTLRLPVFGSIRPLMKSHYDKLGFNPEFAHVLVEASEATLTPGPHLYLASSASSLDGRYTKLEKS